MLTGRILKIGKVKFFDHKVNNFGFIVGLSDGVEYRVSPTNILTPPLNADEIVVYETIKNNEGKYSVANVSKNIPVFIFNNDSSKRSFAYPLIGNQLEKEIVLTGKYETGYATVTANYLASQWRNLVISANIILKEESTTFSKAILIKLLPKLNEYKATIEWLTSFLQTELKEVEIYSIYNDAFINFEHKPIPEITKEIEKIKDISFFKIYLEEKKKTLNKISFVLWTLDEVEKLPNPSKQEEDDIWRYEVLPSLAWKKLQQVLTKLLSEQGPTKQVEESYKYLIGQGWEINSKEELQEVTIFLEEFKTVFPSISLEETNYRCNANQFYIELYNSGSIKELSEVRTKQYIEELKTDDEKARFIEKLQSDKILSYYFSFPSLSNYQKKYIAGMLESEFSKIDFLCFDLESDGEKINEFAWKSRLDVKSESDFKKQEDGIAELITLINSGTLIIGQNIKGFDLSVLANYGASPSSDFIWDTLEVEMLLNPERFSYGLSAEAIKHSALSDTETTYRLFKNQLSRIIVSQSNLDAVKELLPSKAIEAINQISSNSNWALLNYEYFVKQSNEFFRPNPTNQNISEQTFNQLTEKLNEEGNKVVIAPEFLWNTLSYQFDLTFYSDNKSLGLCLNKEKIEETLGDDKLLKVILFRFMDSCISKGLQPYLQHLPIAISLKLNSEQSTLICDNIDVDFGNINHKPICIKPTDIEILKQHGNQVSDLKVIVVGNELYNLTSKLQLGQNFDFATIFDRLKNEPIWLQMSGGKSFISLEQSHCRQLGITEFPEFVQNIWLEKIGKGKFKVWCNLNFEACINDLPISESYYIDWVDETFTKTNSFIIRPDARKSGYIAEQKRVNPESLYRKIYWVYQFKLIEGIGNTNNPKVLIVNDELETEKLSAYARRKGYFIPDTKASLARQVELLHTHRSSNKLLIASFLTLDKIISSNYTGPLDFIWDSFLLQEKLQMLKGKVHKDEIETTENSNYIPSLKGDLTNKGDFDTYKLFRLHKPLVDYYYKMIIDNNQESNLFLCDTRLADFIGIEKSLELKSKYVTLWNRIEEYEADYKVASDFFPSDLSSDNNFDVIEAKQILRQLFLPKKDNGEFFEWYDYQDKCLDAILPAKKDLLISLPTGAGKSVLFQAPSLFRSSFTNKLNIVISPLRALMHDQVEILHEMGLYSNVEYLSGDKSQEEIKDIYRRIVGGEITLLYITPERFRSRSFENCLFTRLDADSGLEYVVFDEAHCISQWGQEFRPDYLNAGRKVAGYSGVYQMRKLLFSATISEQVFEEISILMPGVVTVEGTEKSYNPVRDHIKMDFKHNMVEDDRLLEVANYLKSGKFNPKLSRAIIFVKSRKKVEECSLIMSDSLKDVFGADCSFAEKVGAFHAGMDAEDRKDTYEKYKSGEILILFATKAFGMGMDIPNIHFVTHYSPPSTFEDFLQEVGRAGRNEKQRLEAGFNSSKNPIKTLCLTGKDDFRNLKDQLHKSRISWHEVKDIKQVLEEYISRFKPLTPDTEIPVAVPFNLYSNVKGSTDDETDTKFRIALHWLERLERIKLGYFTITHLSFKALPLYLITEEDIKKCQDNDCKKVCNTLLDLLPKECSDSELQFSIATLRSNTKLSLENLFKALLQLHKIGIIYLIQDVVIEPTNLRNDELLFYSKSAIKNKYPALKTIFSFAREILNSITALDSKVFDGEELDSFFKNCIDTNLSFEELPWPINLSTKSSLKTKEIYCTDITKKRFKHAFTIVRLLGKTKCTSEFEKVVDSNKKVRVVQTVYNGYHKKEEWSNKIAQLEKDCINLLDYVAKQYFDKNIKSFNWPDIISDLDFKGNVQYLSDLLFILSVLGYSKTGGLLPSGIEIYLHSTELIDETQDENNDKIIYNEFNETQEIRELKLISLQLLSKLDDDKKDAFIKGFFASKTKLELINHLQNVGDIDDHHPIFKAFRGEAIKYQEVNRLNDEQRKIYFSDVNQNINVVAGPGSGKTHTLTLRVARLVYYKFANPEEILVLAYNRAVVSELKERLGKLFKDLGFGNLAKRIKIFTFHGLAKKYCQEQLEGLKFEEWEPKLHQILNDTPGIIMNQLAPLRHVLVDEFQDIDEVRMDLLCRLNDLTKANLFIIGDPNQSIYGYSRKVMDPYYYYKNFDYMFNPAKFTLLDNHRSYPDILTLASQILTLPEENQHLIPKATKNPNENFIENYVEVIDNIVNPEIKWWHKINELLSETIIRAGETLPKPYKQIAILFRTNNEAYKGFQRIKGLGLPNVRIRIQGSLPYEFTRIRECHSLIELFRKMGKKRIPTNFIEKLKSTILNLISKHSNWNDYYLKVIFCIVIDYLKNTEDENFIFNNLVDYIAELSYKDDGQLRKIYDSHISQFEAVNDDIEVVLTTMHKVKGLEFDCVLIPPSFSELPFLSNKDIPFEDQINEEKRLAFVAQTRARYRLIIFNGDREKALKCNFEYKLHQELAKKIGYPVKPELSKLFISWSATSDAFNSRINDFIKTNVNSGAEISLIGKSIFYNDIKIAHLSSVAFDKIPPIDKLIGFVVNEIVVWTFEETIASDLKNGTTYATNWCHEARQLGYIYLVDFVGFGVPSDL